MSTPTGDALREFDKTVKDIEKSHKNAFLGIPNAFKWYTYGSFAEGLLTSFRQRKVVSIFDIFGSASTMFFKVFALGRVHNNISGVIITPMKLDALNMKLQQLVNQLHMMGLKEEVYSKLSHLESIIYSYQQSLLNFIRTEIHNPAFRGFLQRLLVDKGFISRHPIGKLVGDIIREETTLYRIKV